MKKTAKKLTLSRTTIRNVSDGLLLVGGGLETDYVGCSITCSQPWDSDVVKLREGGGGKEGK